MADGTEDRAKEGPRARVANSSDAFSDEAVSPRGSEDVRRIVARAVRRQRLQVGVAAVLRWLPVVLLAFVPLVLIVRWTEDHRVLVIGGGLALVAAAVFQVAKEMRSVRSMAVALALDRHLGFGGRLAGAYDWLQSEGSDDSRTFAQLAWSRGAQVTPSSSSALPWPRLRSGWALAALALLFVAFAAPLRPTPRPLARQGSPILPTKTPWLLGDDAELLEERAAELQSAMSSDEGEVLAGAFNQLIAKAAAGEITQQEAFALAADLEAKVDERAAVAAAVRKGLQERGRALSKFSPTGDTGRALAESRFRDAEEALRTLAERLRDEREGLTPHELEQLRQSIEEMREEVEERRASDRGQDPGGEQQALERRVAELEEKEQSGKASEAEREELARKRRELKRLERRKKEPSEVRQELSELDRQLAEAARQLAEERQKSSEFLEQSAQSVRDAVARQLSDEEKKELIRQLRELKERLRRQKEGTDQAQQRMERFQQRARGQKPGQGKDGKPGPSGPPQVTLGPDGQALPVPGAGQENPSSGESEGKAGESEASGSKPGNAHDPAVAGEEGRLGTGAAVDASAVGQDTGEGASASETIRTAAEEGFASANYEKLFVEYETVAEEKMQSLDVPAGRRSQVLRYFELIRPREGARK